MQNEEKGMGKGLLIGSLIGAAVGSLIALLYTPKSGKELRKNIKTKSQDIIENADRYIVKTKDKASQLLRGSTKKSQKWLKGLKKKLTFF